MPTMTTRCQLCWAGHRSPSFRRPTMSLRDGSNTRSTCRLIALMIPMRANNVARLVLRPATALPSRAAIRRHRVRPWGSLVMYVAASRSVTIGFRPGTAIGSTNRLSQDTNLHLPLIGGATREYGTGSKHFSKILTSWTRSSCGGRL